MQNQKRDLSDSELGRKEAGSRGCHPAKIEILPVLSPTGEVDTAYQPSP